MLEYHLTLGLDTLYIRDNLFEGSFPDVAWPNVGKHD